MKQLYCLLFGIMLANSNAQITQNFNEPIIGDTDKNYRLDTSAYTTGLPISITGSNCVWNFANLLGTFPVVVDSFITPSAAVNGTAYTAATYAQHRDVLYTFYKSSSSPSQTELLGAYSPSLSLTFTNSAIIANYPINFGYSASDPVSGNFKANTQNGACVGNISISAPGQGTLILPNSNVFQNVICLRSVEILTLSLGISPIGTFNQTIYNYYAPGIKFPVLNINYTTYQFIAGTPTITAYVYGHSDYFSVAGIRENQLDKSDYDIFPNPFHERLIVTSRSSYENEYVLYDIHGKCVLRAGSYESMHTEELAAGVYILQIRNKYGQLHQKVIKD